MKPQPEGVRYETGMRRVHPISGFTPPVVFVEPHISMNVSCQKMIDIQNVCGHELTARSELDRYVVRLRTYYSIISYDMI